MKHYKIMASAVFALLILAACGTSGNNGIGDIFGGGSPSARSYQIEGTVDSVDQNNRSIVLTNVNTSASLNSGSGRSVRIYYDERTTLSYQGRAYQPGNLERGDEVSARVDDTGNQLIAESMDLTHDTRGGMASSSNGSNGGYGNEVIHGTVRSVDASRRTISIDRGYGSDVTVEYNTNTPVSFNGRSYRAVDLEPGDQIDVRTSDLGRGRLNADDITVTRALDGMGSTRSSTSLLTIRGTVLAVDRTNRTIELENTSWSSGFQTNGGSRTVVHYGSNTSVDYNGQTYPVTNLERGDVVDVHAEDTGSAGYFAQTVVLVRNVNGR